MAQNIKPGAQKAAAKPEDPTAPKASSKKLMLGIIGALLLVIAAGAGWFLSKGQNSSHVEEVKVAPPKTPIFVTLEPFTVNLQRESGDQYLQLGLSLKIFEAENEAKIKSSLPEIRSKILQLLTTKTATELLTAEGKTKLVKEIMGMSNAVIGIVDAPAHAAPVQPVAPPAPHAGEGETAAQGEAASAPVAPVAAAAKAPAEKKGIVDVLFTSFIIQ